MPPRKVGGACGVPPDAGAEVTGDCAVPVGCCAVLAGWCAVLAGCCAVPAGCCAGLADRGDGEVPAERSPCCALTPATPSMSERTNAARIPENTINPPLRAGARPPATARTEPAEDRFFAMI